MAEQIRLSQTATVGACSPAQRPLAPYQQPRQNSSVARQAAAIRRSRAANKNKLSPDLLRKLEYTFGCSLGHVRLFQQSRLAREHGHKAVAVEQNIHFADSIDEEQDKAIIAHEVAHTLQQQRSSQRHHSQQSQATERYEYEADRASEAFLKGATFRVQLSSPTRVMGWKSKEHKQLGDTLGKDVELAPDFYCTFGDMTAMMGDYFESPEQIRQFASRKGNGPGTREEVRYVLFHLVRNTVPKSKFMQTVRDAVQDRHRNLAAKNTSHFVRDKAAETELPALSPKTLLSSLIDPRLPDSRRAYRKYHTKAILCVVRSGLQKRAGLPHEEQARLGLLYESTASHYLTDSFAAGHFITPRKQLRKHWNTRNPTIKKRAVQAARENVRTGISFLARKRIKTAIHGIIDKFGFTAGDLISAIAHDYYNHVGLLASSPTRQLWFYGDGRLNHQPPASTEHIELTLHYSFNELAEIRQRVADGESPSSVIQWLQENNFAAEKHFPGEVEPFPDFWFFPGSKLCLKNEFREGASLFANEVLVPELGKARHVFNAHGFLYNLVQKLD